MLDFILFIFIKYCLILFFWKIGLISLYILNNPYDEVVKRLKDSKITDNSIGFDLDESDD